MKQLNPNTKKAQYFIYAYRNARYTSIYEAYTKPSTNKTRADYFCRKAMQDEGGQGYKIISASCHFFSVGWMEGDNLRIETVGNSYIIPNAI